VLEELGQMAQELSPAPVSIIVFGSFARGEADSQSDLDVVVVRPVDVDQDDEAWTTAVERWRLGARRLTGNAVEVIEVGETEIGRLLRRKATIWRDVAREGVVAFGSDLTALKGRRSA
jgi:predicted nucleotidyltransferase